MISKGINFVIGFLLFDWSKEVALSFFTNQARPAKKTSLSFFPLGAGNMHLPPKFDCDHDDDHCFLKLSTIE